MNLPSDSGSRSRKNADGGNRPARRRVGPSRIRDRFGARGHKGSLSRIHWITGLITLVSLALIGCETFPSSSEEGVLLRETFSDPEPEFSLDIDREVEFSVAAGAYRIVVKDPRRAQVARHILDRSVTDMRFEATVTQVTNLPGFFSMGCWRGDKGYLLAVTPDRFSWLIETIEGSTRLRSLTEADRALAIRPAGTPSRLRIDCVGANDGPAVVTAYANDVRLASLDLPDRVPAFDTVGFLVQPSVSDAEYRVDDVLVTGGLTQPPNTPPSPTVPASGADGSSQSLDWKGVRFEYPDDWVFTGDERPGELEGDTWQLSVGPADGRLDDWIRFYTWPRGTDPTLERKLEDPAAFAEALAASASGRAVGEPDRIRVDGLKGFQVRLGRMVGPHDQALAGEAVVLLGEEKGYILLIQYEPKNASPMLEAWNGVLESFQG